MKQIVIVAITIFYILLCTSCMTPRHNIGDGPVGNKGQTKIYSRAKQAYLFWGLTPLGRPDPAKPSHGNYQIKTGYNVGDCFLNILTLGIVSFRTVRIVTYKDDDKTLKKSK